MTLDVLQDKFRSLWARLGAQSGAAGEFDVLQRCYGNPSRRYHTLDHIASGLDVMAEAGAAIVEPDLVEFAFWYHDIVYDTTAKAPANEQMSANVASAVAYRAGFGAVTIRRVADLILLTTHQTPTTDPAACALLDVDLSSLGATAEEYEANEQNIREEYRWVPEQKFWSARTAILKSIFSRPWVYYTDWFRNRFEESARRNILGSIRRGDDEEKVAIQKQRKTTGRIRDLPDFDFGQAFGGGKKP